MAVESCAAFSLEGAALPEDSLWLSSSASGMAADEAELAAGDEDGWVISIDAPSRRGAAADWLALVEGADIADDCSPRSTDRDC